MNPKRKNSKLVITFGKRLKELRTIYKLTQAQLADILDTDAAYIGKLESGKREPSLSTLNDLAMAFGLTLNKFLDF